MGIHGKTHQLVLYDFGNVIELPKDVQFTLKKVMLLMLERDINGIIKLLPKLGITVNQPDALFAYISSYINYIESLDVKDLLITSSLPSSIKGNKVPMTVNIDMLCLLRVFSMLEGLCKDLDKNFSYQSVWPVVLYNMTSDREIMRFKAERDFCNLIIPT